MRRKLRNVRVDARDRPCDFSRFARHSFLEVETTSTSAGIPDTIVDYLRSRPAGVALHRACRRLPHSTRSDGDARCEFILRFSSLFILRARVAVLFLTNDHEHPIAAPSLPRHRLTRVRPLDRPPVCARRAAMSS